MVDVMIATPPTAMSLGEPASRPVARPAVARKRSPPD